VKVYTFSQARQQLAALLNQAKREGKVRIRRRDGQEFVVEPVSEEPLSPFDVAGLDLAVSVTEIVDVVREGRTTDDRALKSLLPGKALQRTARKVASRARR